MKCKKKKTHLHFVNEITREERTSKQLNTNKFKIYSDIYIVKV